jgi:hypothetical protein
MRRHQKLRRSVKRTHETALSWNAKKPEEGKPHQIRGQRIAPGNARTETNMSATNAQQAIGKTRRLLPAQLADAHLDHLDRLVQRLLRADDERDCRGINHEYCGKRLRLLAETYDLVLSQRHRVLTLLDLLERQAVLRKRNRTAA